RVLVGGEGLRAHAPARQPGDEECPRRTLRLLPPREAQAAIVLDRENDREAQARGIRPERLRQLARPLRRAPAPDLRRGVGRSRGGDRACLISHLSRRVRPFLLFRYRAESSPGGRRTPSEAGGGSP